MFFLPYVVPRVSAAITWRFMYFPLIGIYSYLLSLFKIGPIAFLSSPGLAFFAISLVDIWQWGPFLAALMISSIDLLPSDIIEAAKLECKNKFQEYRYVIFPALTPIIFFLILIKMLDSMRAFDLIYNITKGGPGIATETLDLYAFYIGVIWAGEISYASAMSVFMLIITIAFINLVWSTSKKWVTY